MMISVDINLIRPGSAEGWYAVKAKGYILSVLFWGGCAGRVGRLEPVCVCTD